MKKTLYAKTVTTAVMITFLLSALYVAGSYIILPLFAYAPGEAISISSDHVLMLLQCLLGMAVLLLPELLRCKFGLALPHFMLVILALFLFCSIYLGEIHGFYFRVPHWDTMLHTFSGGALCALGFSIASHLSRSRSLNPVLLVLFAFCFSISMSVLWEIYEFTVDALFYTNMQKFCLEGGELLVGQAAILDTMKDLIVDAVGSLAMAIAGAASLRQKNGWLERFRLTAAAPRTVAAKAEPNSHRHAA